MKKIFAVAVGLSLASAICGQTVKPLAKLEAPGKIDFAVVCEGGETVVGVAGAHEVSVWSLPSGTRRTVSAMNGRASAPLAWHATGKRWRWGQTAVRWSYSMQRERNGVESN